MIAQIAGAVFLHILSVLPCYGAEPITIGLSLGLTGKYSIMANIQEKSYRLWVEETNKTGGILGREIQLTIIDDQSSPQRAISAYSNFIERDKVDLLFAPFSSEITRAVLPLAEKNHYPIIASGAASDSLWETGSRYIFGIFTPASKITVSFLEMLVMNNIDNLTIFYAQDDPFSKDVAEGCQKWARRFGLTIKHIESFNKTDVDFNALTAIAIKAGGEVVIMCGHLNEAIKMKQALDLAGWRPKAYYASQGPNQILFRETLKNSANYVFATEQWNHLGGVTTPETKTFINKFISEYGFEPTNYFAVTPYAAGQILEKAIISAGSLDRKKIRDEIAGLDFNCLIGRFKVDRYGRPIKNYTIVLQIQNLLPEVVWPQAIMTAQPIFQ